MKKAQILDNFGPEIDIIPELIYFKLGLDQTSKTPGFEFENIKFINEKGNGPLDNSQKNRYLVS